MTTVPNHRAGADVGLALVLLAGDHGPGTAQHDRWASQQSVSPATLDRTKRNV